MDEDGGNRNWLSDNGGWVLVIAGVGLIILAAHYSTRPAVAPIFAFTGFASIVFGVVLPRVEGAAELSASRVKFILVAARRKLADGRRTPEEVGDLLEESLDEIDSVVSSARKWSVQRTAGPRSAQALLSGVQRAALLEEKVGQWLVENGWSVDDYDRRSPDRGWDFTARRGGETLVVEVKASMRMGAASVAAIALRVDDLSPDVQHAVLVVAEHSLSRYAIQQGAAAADVLSTYIAKDDGSFELVTGPDAVAAKA